MDRIFRKEVENKIRLNTKREEISLGNYCINGKKSMNAVMRNLTLTESIELLQKEFLNASIKFGVGVEKVKFNKPVYRGEISTLTAYRFETDKEMEERIQRNTNIEVDRLRNIKACNARLRFEKKKKIEKLKKEIENLN